MNAIKRLAEVRRKMIDSRGEYLGTIVVVILRNAETGRCYGVREIGDRKSWHRWMTPDGKKHRFAKDAVRHLDGQQLARHAAEMRRRAEVVARREAEAERRTMDALAKIAERWHARVQVEKNGIVQEYVRPAQVAALA